MIPVIDANTLKIISAVSMFIGTLLVSWRVTNILNSLSNAVKVHDFNFEVMATRQDGLDFPYIQLYGMNTQLDKAEKTGTKLLVAGFIMQIIGVVFNIASFLY